MGGQPFCVADLRHSSMGPAPFVLQYNILAQHGMGGAWPYFAWRVLDSGSAWHGWSLPVCWILAQHGMGGAWPCFAWRVLARSSDRSDPLATSRASYLSVLRPRPCWELAVPQDGPESGSGG